MQEVPSNMKKKIIALLLTLTLLSGTCAYAVPVDLWNGDNRVVGLFAEKEVAITNFDILQEVISYLEIAKKEDISGDKEVKPGVILKALCEITGIYYDENVENKTMLEALKAAKLMRSETKASLLSLQDLLYAAGRITGWVEEPDNDGQVYSQAKKAGLMTNIIYSTGRNLTRSEAAQLIYNILAVNKAVPVEYNENYISFEKDLEEPILQSKYGVTFNEGVVTSVFGETVYNTNKLKTNEIEIDGKVYKIRDGFVSSNLLGRQVGFFLNEEENMVLFAEATVKNQIHVINYGEDPQFKSGMIEYETVDGEEYEVEVDSETKVIYNGLLAGNYTPSLAEMKFSESANITAVDNDDDGVYNYLIIRSWETFVVDTGAGAEGVFSFAYDKTFNGSGSFDLTPDDKYVHVTLLKDGVPAEYTEIKDGGIVSISATENETGHKYIVVEAGYKMLTGTLGSAYANTYVIDDIEYPVSADYLSDQETIYEVRKPTLGQSYSFYVDVTGRIVFANVSKGDYTFGYLVKINSTRGMNANYSFKIFSQDGKMYEYPLAEKVKVYDAATPEGNEVEAKDLALRITSEADADGDYRRLLQYKLKSGEVSDVWFALDNTLATVYGESGYQFTLDKINPTYVYYEGGLITYPNDGGGSADNSVFWGKSTILFAIPTDKNAVDGKYSIKSVSYNGSRWTEPTDFYCVDDWNIIEAAVMHMSAEAGIDNYSPVYVVDKVVAAVDLDGSKCYRVYGYDKGNYTSFLLGEDVVSDPGKGNFANGLEVTGDQLQFGDLVQVCVTDGVADSLRLVYRLTDQEDFDMSNTAAGTTGGQLEIKTGSFGGKRGSMFRFIQKKGGVELPTLRAFTASTAAFMIDTASKKVKKTSFADLAIGDKIVMHSKWGTMVSSYIYR